MKKIWVIALIALVLVGVCACSVIEKNVKSVVKITVYDEKGQTYGYITIMLIDSAGKVVKDDQANERGVSLMEGVPSGIYTFVVKNAAGIELTVISPENMSVRPGKTSSIDLKVQSAAAAQIIE
jgi:hypothetical protein